MKKTSLSIRSAKAAASALLAATLLSLPLQAKTHLKIAATGDAIEAFQNWTAVTHWEDIAHYKNRNATRPTVDLLLELQALKAGGLDFDFEFVRALTYDLAKTEVIEGRADLCAETIWDNEIADHAAVLLHTDPIIRDGEFVKGIYVLPANKPLLAVQTIDALRNYTGAVVGSWTLDLKTMAAMNLKALVKKPTPELVYQAIQRQQADFTLAEFSSSPDMSSELGGVRLVPVSGYKVAIEGSRSWVVAKSSPGADVVLKALSAGVEKLRGADTIVRAYQESGFFNPRVADWKRLF